MKVAFSAVTLCFVLLFVEGGARWLGPVTPGWQGGDTGTIIMVGHPTRLWGMGAGVRKNGETTATIHPVGLREPLVDRERPEGQERILVLGDSSFFGHGLEDDETMVVRVGELLRTKGMDVDTVNGAIPGYSTEQTLLMLEEVGWAFDPTVLVLGSLWSDNNFDHFQDQDLLKTRQSFGTGLLRKSAMLRILAGWSDRLRGGYGAKVITWTKESEWPEGSIRRVALKRYGENLDFLVRSIHEKGGQALFIAPANRDLVSGENPDLLSWSPYFNAQRAVAEHWGAPIVDTAALFQDEMKRNPSVDIDDLFLDEMHPTIFGSDLLANALASTLLETGWPEKDFLTDAGEFPFGDLVDAVGEGRRPGDVHHSPQTNLFPVSEDNTRGLEDMPSGQGSKVIQGGPIAGWTFTGKVQAASWPVRVEIADVSGSGLGTVIVGEGGDFRFTVRPGVDDIQIKMTDPNGVNKTETMTKSHAGNSIEMNLTGL